MLKKELTISNEKDNHKRYQISDVDYSYATDKRKGHGSVENIISLM